MKKLLGALAGFVALSTGLLLGIASPASAQPVGCIAGQACLWTGSDNSGTVHNYAFSTYFRNGACNYLGSFGATVSSAYNDYGSGYRLVLWKGDCHNSSLWNVYGQTGAELAGTGWDNNVVAFTIQPL